MTKRPGDCATEMNGGSIASYLAPRVPFSMLIFVGLEAKGLLDFQGRCGIASVVRWKLRPVTVLNHQNGSLQPPHPYHPGQKSSMPNFFGSGRN